MLDGGQSNQEIGGPMVLERLRRPDIEAIVAPGDDIGSKIMSRWGQGRINTNERWSAATNSKLGGVL